MTRLLVLSVLLITLLLGTPASAADWMKGVDAARRGDYATAVREWKPLAEQGKAYAQYSLALMYIEGKGVTKDYKTAFKWYTLAAEQGDARAQYHLGKMYFRGEGVIKDYVLAHMWINIAASNGMKRAITAREMIDKVISPTQIETAQNLARECVRKKYKGC